MVGDRYLDRRGYLRIPVDTDVLIRRQGEKESWRGITRNLSGAGILLETDRSVNPGQVIEIQVLPAAEQFSPLEATVTVVRVEEPEPGRYMIAGEMRDIR